MRRWTTAVGVVLLVAGVGYAIYWAVVGNVGVNETAGPLSVIIGIVGLVFTVLGMTGRPTPPRISQSVTGSSVGRGVTQSANARDVTQEVVDSDVTDDIKQTGAS